MSAAAKKAWADTMATHSGVSVKWGPNNVDCLLSDTKRLAFLFSRYKFAAKMMHSCSNILDVGCGDGMGTLMFLDTAAKRIVGLDIEASLIDHADNEIMPALDASRRARLEFICEDFGDSFRAVEMPFDGLCCMDMIEHVDPAEAEWYIAQFSKLLLPHGVAVIGTPSARAAQYGSVHSKAGHINLYEPEQFRATLERNFGRVFLFSVNDEMVHTGFLPMAHYLMAVAVK